MTAAVEANEESTSANGGTTTAAEERMPAPKEAMNRRRESSFGARAGAGRGFTLIELVIALSIVAILVGASVAGFSAINADAKETAAIRDIYAQARQARQQARSRGQAVRMKVVDEVVDGIPRQVIRWERLPCSDSWGTECPVAACQATTAACGAGCACEATGERVIAPRKEDLDLGTLNGLCFHSNGLAYADCSVTLDPALPPPPPVTQLVMKSTRNPAMRPFALELSSMTGALRLKDCASVSGSDAGCL